MVKKPTSIFAKNRKKGARGGTLIGGASDRVPSPAAQLTLCQKDDWRWNSWATSRRSRDIRVRNGTRVGASCAYFWVSYNLCYAGIKLHTYIRIRGSPNRRFDPNRVRKFWCSKVKFNAVLMSIVNLMSFWCFWMWVWTLLYYQLSNIQ